VEFALNTLSKTVSVRACSCIAAVSKRDAILMHIDGLSCAQSAAEINKLHLLYAAMCVGKNERPWR
jgi:hypothetical protein